MSLLHAAGPAPDELHPSPLADLERRARALVPAEVWRYLQQGSGRGLTLARNREAFGRQVLMPRPLADMRHGSTTVELFGRTLPHPLMLAPVAYQRLFHADGEIGTAMAAQAQDTLMVVSSLSSQPLEQIAATGVRWWFQLYWQGTRDRTLRLLRRAELAGAQAIVFTVDAPVKSASLELPAGIEAVNLEPTPAEVGAGVFTGWMQQAPRWDDLDWLRGQTPLPLCVKGLLHVDDALRAARLGADAIGVSNHGGRVLDGTPAALDVLPAMVQALGPATPILFDSGIRSGHDALVALQRGARAVMVGRPAIWGLAAEGALGVARVLRILRDELEMAMALCGQSDLHGTATPARS